jgi:N-acetylneuraminic acid mutarotase
VKRPRTIPRVGSVLVFSAFAVAAGIVEPGYCQDRPLPGWGAKALPTHPGWNPTGNLNAARCGHTATLLASGKVLVVGGSGGECSSIKTKTLNSAELYDPVTGSWSVTGSLKQPRTSHTATLLPSGLVLVVGGVVASATSFETISTAELYDPDAGDWKSTGNLIAQRAYHTATLLQNGTVLVAGGWGGGSGALDSAELYDPSTGTWSRTGNLITGRYWHTATQLQNGKVLVAGGLLDVAPNRGQIEASAELYDPVSGAWTRTGDLNEVRSQHTATRMQDGKVLVASGDNPYDYGEANGTAEIYDPGTATWSNTGNLRVIRDSLTATLLPSGKVLVTGGVYFSVKNGAELYDPVSRTWAPTGDVSTPRFFGHTATLLSDGRVLVAAGASEADTPTALDSAELYDDGAPPPTSVPLIEYFYAAFDHYFITSNPDEISGLDRSARPGWVRTGLQFNAFAAPNVHSVPVCRFFSGAAFAPKSSHFYTPFATECAIRQVDPAWTLESSDAFDIAVPAPDGSCAAGLTPVYRLYNNGQGGAPNHRYTTDLTVRAQMIAQGWVPEGLGPNAVEMCSPL